MNIWTNSAGREKAMMIIGFSCILFSLLQNSVFKLGKNVELLFLVVGFVLLFMVYKAYTKKNKPQKKKASNSYIFKRRK